ncbi:MAG: dienelactone hydrolase family protein [Ilumatobacteraceae bacterium]
MAEILLFHHVCGLTDGVTAFAGELRRAGHVVHTPGLFGGLCFASIDDGMAFVDAAGFDTLVERGVAAADGLPDAIVVAGFSLGVIPAQRLAQTRPGTAGALLYHACAPADAFGNGWPHDVPVQVHGMDADPFFAGEGDLDAARALVAAAPDANLFTYPGTQHLFADRSLDDYVPEAAALLLERTLEFLTRIDARR